MMNALALELASRLPLGLAMVTLLMAAGCVCVAAARAPALRQRFGEFALAGVLAWMLLAVIPLPRLFPLDNTLGSSLAVAAPRGTLAGENRAEQPKIEPSGRAPTETHAAPPLVKEHAQAKPQARQAAPIHVAAPRLAASNLRAGRPAIVRDASALPAVNQLPHGKPTIGWLELAAWIYLAAAGIAAGWLVIGHLLLVRERWTAELAPPWLSELLNSAAMKSVVQPAVQSAAVRRRNRLPRLLVSRRCARPLCYGIWRPMIVLPEQSCRSENREQLTTILLHEMAHILRGDAWGNLLFEAGFPLLLAHPLYWWLRSQTRLAAELVADDWAARQTGKEAYVAELVNLAKSSPARRLSPIAATSVFSSPSQFFRRMQMLLARETPLAMSPSRIWKLGSFVALLLSITVAAALTGTGPAAGQQAPEIKAKDEPNPTPSGPAALRSAAAPPSISTGGTGQSIKKSDTTLRGATNPYLLIYPVAAGLKPSAPPSVGIRGAVADLPQVAVVHPIERDVSDYYQFTGQTEAAQHVELKSRATGALTKIAFRGGEMVKQGELLFEIDPRLYQAELDKADAELQREKSHVVRLRALVQGATASASDVDDAQAALRVAQSNLEIAALQLSYTRITAPFSGKISRPSLDAGSLVNADSTVLGRLDSVDPINVQFEVDEPAFREIQKRKTALAARGKTEEPAVLMQVGQRMDPSYHGRISYVDTRFKPTNTISFTAAFPNPDAQIIPGMYANVQIITSDPHPALLVPSSARFSTDNGARVCVLLVNNQNFTVLHPVTLGEEYDGIVVAVLAGLSKSDWIVNDPSKLHFTGGVRVAPQREETAPDKALRQPLPN